VEDKTSFNVMPIRTHLKYLHNKLLLKTMVTNFLERIVVVQKINVFY